MLCHGQNEAVEATVAGWTMDDGSISCLTRRLALFRHCDIAVISKIELCIYSFGECLEMLLIWISQNRGLAAFIL